MYPSLWLLLQPNTMALKSRTLSHPLTSLVSGCALRYSLPQTSSLTPRVSWQSLPGLSSGWRACAERCPLTVSHSPWAGSGYQRPIFTGFCGGQHCAGGGSMTGESWVEARALEQPAKMYRKHRHRVRRLHSPAHTSKPSQGDKGFKPDDYARAKLAAKSMLSLTAVTRARPPPPLVSI